MSAHAETISASASAAPGAAGPWIYRPWLDLVVGCGAWSAPLLLVTAWLSPSHTHAWVVGFYFLAIVFNYPHFMATVYRAYRTREQFEKYKFFTLHLTLRASFCTRRTGCCPGSSRSTSAGARGITRDRTTA